VVSQNPAACAGCELPGAQVDLVVSSGADINFPDADSDSIRDDVDNAPVNFNPDQSDFDEDSVGDVADPCPGDPTDLCHVDGSAAKSIDSAGGKISTADGSVTITVPADTLSDDTSIAVTRLDTNFEFTTTIEGQPAKAVFSVEFAPANTTFTPPMQIVFTWDDTDNDGVVDGTLILEKNLQIMKDGDPITGACEFETNCTPDANTFSFETDSFSEFTLAATEGPVPNIIGQTQTDAQAATLAAGMSLGPVTLVTDDFIATGVVISTNPVAGQTVPFDTPIALEVSAGPTASGSSGGGGSLNIYSLVLLFLAVLVRRRKNFQLTSQEFYPVSTDGWVNPYQRQAC
jgi:hypothetical protein